MKTLRTKFILTVLMMVLLILIVISLRYYLWRRDIDRRDSAHDLYQSLCRDYLEHGISAEDFCRRLMDPHVLLDRKGEKVIVELNAVGRVTLKGQEDYSGTEIAVLIEFDSRSHDEIMMSPFIVVTDKNGNFDLSSIKPDAWKVVANPRRRIFSVWTCYATPEIKPPSLFLYIRHKDFDSISIEKWLWHFPFESKYKFPDDYPERKSAKPSICSVELLPTGKYWECYRTFIGNKSFITFSLTGFSAQLCSPSIVLAHADKCHDCPFADDAMMYYLMSFYSKPLDEQRNAIEEFRRRFMNGRDNLGVLTQCHDNVPLEGSWKETIDKAEAQFLEKFARSVIRKELADDIRKHPDHIIYISHGRFSSGFDDSHISGSSSGITYTLDDDAIYLLCLGLTRFETRNMAQLGIIEKRVKRAVTFIADIIVNEKVNLDSQYARTLVFTAVDIIGTKQMNPREFVTWWNITGSKMGLPTEPVIEVPEVWFDKLNEKER